MPNNKLIIRHRSNFNSGVSLLEVLISILILSVGLLGLGGLQTRALGFSQSAMFRAQATILADDILERMRVDRQNVISGAWATEFTASSANQTTKTGFIKTELIDWKTQVENSLPQGQASIEIDTVTNPGRVTVSLRWDDSKGVGDPQVFVTQTRF